MNVGKYENSYLSKYKNKKISQINTADSKNEKSKFGNLKDWEDMNYNYIQEHKIVSNETNELQQGEKLQTNENIQISTITNKKLDSPNNFSMNTFNFTNKFNEFIDKIEMSQMTTNDQINSNLTNKKNLTFTSTDNMTDIDRVNIFNEIPCDVIEETEEEEFKINQSDLNVENKMIELNGDLIITDRSIKLKDELDSLYFEDSLNESVDRFYQKPNILRERNEKRDKINGIEKIDKLENVDSRSDNKILNNLNRIILKPNINGITESENNSQEKNYGNYSKKIRLISPYVRNYKNQESINNESNYNIVNLNLYNNNVINPNLMKYYSGVIPPPHVNKNFYYQGLINHNDPMKNIKTEMNLNNQYNFTFNPINHLRNDIIRNDMISPSEYNSPHFNNLNTQLLNKNDSSSLSLVNSFRNAPKIKYNCSRMNSAASENSLLNLSKKDSSNIIYRPYSYKENKTNFEAVPLKQKGCLGPDTKTKEWEEKNKKAQKLKEYAKNIKEMNKNNLVMNKYKEKVTIKEDDNTNVSIKNKNKEEKLNFTFDNINIIESECPNNVEISSNNSSLTTNNKMNNGYSHIHSIRRLKSINDKKEDKIGKKLENNETNVESKVQPRPKSCVRLSIVNKEKEKEMDRGKMFSKIYTTLHDEKKTQKIFNDSLLNKTERFDNNFSNNSIKSNFSKIRPHSMRQLKKIKIKNKDKEYIATQANTIELLLEKNKMYNEKVESIKSFINSKLYK